MYVAKLKMLKRQCYCADDIRMFLHAENHEISIVAVSSESVS